MRPQRSSSLPPTSPTPSTAPPAAPPPPPPPPPPPLPPSSPITTLPLLPPVELPPPHIHSDRSLRSALIGACKRMPLNSSAHFHLALLYLRLSHPNESLRTFQHLLDLHPSESLQQTSTLLVSFAGLLTSDPSSPSPDHPPLLRASQDSVLAFHPTPLSALGTMYLRFMAFEAASKILHRSLRGCAPVDELVNAGFAHMARGAVNSAKRLWTHALIANPSNVEAAINLAAALTVEQRFAQAARIYRGLLTTAGNGRAMDIVWSGMAVACAGMGRLDLASDAVRNAETYLEGAGFRNRIGLLVWSMRMRKMASTLRGTVEGGIVGRRGRVNAGEMEAYVTKLRGFARELGCSESSGALGVVLRKRHEYNWEGGVGRNFGAEAAERLVEAVERDQKNSSAWTQLALLQVSVGAFHTGVGVAEESLNRGGGAAAWNCWAVAKQLNGDVVSAKRGYEMAEKCLMHENTMKRRRRKQRSAQAQESGDDNEGEHNGEVTQNSQGAQDNQNLQASQVTQDNPASQENPGTQGNHAPQDIQAQQNGGVSQDNEREQGNRAAQDNQRAQDNQDAQDNRRAQDNQDAQDNQRAQDDQASEDAQDEDDTEGDCGLFGSKEDNRSAELKWRRRWLRCVLNNRGNLKRQQGDYEGAMDCYTQALQIGGGEGVIFNNMALVYIKCGSLRAAEQILRHGQLVEPHLECLQSNLMRLMRLRQVLGATSARRGRRGSSRESRHVLRERRDVGARDNQLNINMGRRNARARQSERGN